MNKFRMQHNHNITSDYNINSLNNELNVKTNHIPENKYRIFSTTTTTTMNRNNSSSSSSRSSSSSTRPSERGLRSTMKSSLSTSPLTTTTNRNVLHFHKCNDSCLNQNVDENRGSVKALSKVYNTTATPTWSTNNKNATNRRIPNEPVLPKYERMNVYRSENNKSPFTYIETTSVLKSKDLRPHINRSVSFKIENNNNNNDASFLLKLIKIFNFFSLLINFF
jgi:hypothetical protein